MGLGLTRERAKVAGLKRRRAPDDPVVLEAVRELRVARLAAQIREGLATEPALTDEQRAALARQLAPELAG